ERELRVRIAETLDEPGGGDAVDVRRSRARHPGTPARGQRRPVAPARHARGRFRGAQTLGCRLPQGARALPGRRFQVIDRLDPVQLTLQTVELATKVRDRSAVVRLVAIEVPKNVATPLRHCLVL